MATNDIQTLLSLDEYAEIMGLNPLNFNSAASANENLYGFEADKQPLWFRYDWQAANQMSHYKLSMLLHEAEEAISQLLGYYPAPTWTTFETVKYPEDLPVENPYITRSIKGDYKSVQTEHKKLIVMGKRKTTLIENVAVVYSDEDGDGYEETATITAVTTVTDPKSIKVYFAGSGGDPIDEVRPLKSVTISGGSVTIVMSSWLLFLRELYEVLPGGEPITISADDAANYVATLDIYEISADTTVSSGRFIWSSGSFESSLGAVVLQDAYVRIADYDNGIVIPVPAAYNADTELWDKQCFSKSTLPDGVQLWYQSGLRSERYMNDLDISPMNSTIKRAIAWLATARMDATFRGNNNITAFVDSMRRDGAEQSEGSTFFLGPDALSCPLGTRIGEIAVWRMIKQMDRHYRVGVA